MIRFSHMSVSRGLKTVLRDVTFSVRDRESVAVLGPNGSGKSTLIKTITRELYPEDGSLKLFGKETWDVFELRSRMGIVSNDLQAWFAQDMTGMDAALSGFFSSVGLWKNHRVTPEMKKKALEALKKAGALPLKDRLMDKVSSGEARRLLIARALASNPHALVFDEPTNSLDLVSQRALRTTLSRLARSGHAIFLATHHLADIIPEIKRVIVLKEGRVVADGPKEKLLTPKTLSHAFGIPVRVIKDGAHYHAY